MKKLRFEKLRFEMTRKQALELGLLRCACGHPENNHFSWGKKPCAHCDCKELDEHPVRGRLL